MAEGKILWLDNDPSNIEGAIALLRAGGYEVSKCRTVSEAEKALRETVYDLLILDVMIPITPAEEKDYPYEETEDTLNTGLLFFKRMKGELDARRTEVLVMTVRIDRRIGVAFHEAGLSPDRFVTRFDMRDSTVLLDRVHEIIERRRNGGQ